MGQGRVVVEMMEMVVYVATLIITLIIVITGVTTIIIITLPIRMDVPSPFASWGR